MTDQCCLEMLPKIHPADMLFVVMCGFFFGVGVLFVCCFFFSSGKKSCTPGETLQFCLACPCNES